METLSSGSALNLIAKLPAASVMLSPWVISCASDAEFGLRQYHQLGYCTFLCTRYTTLASVIFAPEKAFANPFTVILSFSLKVSVTGLKSVSNFGRLYSSTEIVVM